jgi:hypothetical protein
MLLSWVLVPAGTWHFLLPSTVKVHGLFLESPQCKRNESNINYFKFFTCIPECFELCVNWDESEATNFQTCIHPESGSLLHIHVTGTAIQRRGSLHFICFLQNGHSSDAKMLIRGRERVTSCFLMSIICITICYEDCDNDGMLLEGVKQCVWTSVSSLLQHIMSWHALKFSWPFCGNGSHL